MSTNRTPLSRARKPVIDDATLTLFVKLEGIRRGDYVEQRGDDDLGRQDCELARRLDLWREWRCSITSVLDDSSEPCHSKGYVAHDDWHTCREVRERLLLEAIRQGLMTGEEPPRTSRERRPTTPRARRGRESRPGLN